MSNFSCRTRSAQRTATGEQPPTHACWPEERKRARGNRLKRSQIRNSSREASARPIRKSGRGCHAPGAAGRGQGHTQGAHTHTTHAYYTGTRFGHGFGIALGIWTKRQGHGRYRRMYCQGGDSDWAALRALKAVEARPGNRPKIASTHESGISFGRGQGRRASINPIVFMFILIISAVGAPGLHLRAFFRKSTVYSNAKPIQADDGSDRGPARGLFRCGPRRR